MDLIVVDTSAIMAILMDERGASALETYRIRYATWLSAGSG